MKTARGNVRKILIKVGEIQSLVGAARGQALNDRDPYMMDKLIPSLEKAFELCLEIRGEYEPVRVKK